MKNTLRYAALVPSPDENSGRMVRRGLAVASIREGVGTESPTYTVACDIGETFVDTEDNILSLPHKGKGSIFAFGRTAEAAITLLHGFISTEKLKLLNRLEDINHELESIETVQMWVEEKKEYETERKEQA